MSRNKVLKHSCAISLRAQEGVHTLSYSASLTQPVTLKSFSIGDQLVALVICQRHFPPPRGARFGVILVRRCEGGDSVELIMAKLSAGAIG